MNKMAIFVEGYTEVVFVDKLIRLIAEIMPVDIRWHQYYGGTTRPQTCRQIRTVATARGHNHFIIIYDCRGDDAVKTRMVKEYDYLTRSGYSKIVCLRDVFDKYTRDQISQLERDLPKYVKTKPIVVDFLLSIMEVESWFLAEHTHYEKIDTTITVGKIMSTLGYNPETDDMQMRDHPAEDLHNSYQIAGKHYTKENASATVEVLDCERMYYWADEKFPYLRKLCEIVGTFLRS
jgi:hypothetical protein